MAIPISKDIKLSFEAIEFYNAIVKAKNDGKEEDKKNNTFGTAESKWFGSCVHTYEVKEYNEMKLFLSEDKMYGVAVKDSGDIVSVFKHPKCSPTTKATDITIPKALELGGNHLDCFNINLGLPFIYSKHKFMPVAKIQFNKEFAPEDWNYARDKEPDIIFMIHKTNAVFSDAPLARKKELEENINSLKFSSSYEEAEKEVTLHLTAHYKDIAQEKNL